MRCPTCGKPIEPANNAALPFCSPRCRQVDLNRWLSEEQRLPVGGLDEEFPEESPDKLAEDQRQASHQEEDSRGE
jgi:uncharacterized protein